MAKRPVFEDIDQYMKDVAAVSPLTAEQEREAGLRYRDFGDKDAFEQLVTSNLRFVVKVAHSFTGYGLPLSDLVQEGNVGLIRGVERFDPDRQYRLITYAVWWIRAHIQSYVMRSWSLVKLGTTQAERKMFFRVRSLRSRFEFENRVGDEEVIGLMADELGLDAGLVRDFEWRLAARDFSIHTGRGKDGEEYETNLTSPNASPEEKAADGEWRRVLLAHVENASSSLDERERFILGHRLLSLEPKSLREVGKEFSISPERVRQLEQRLLARLREGLSRSDFPLSSSRPAHAH